MLVIDSQVHIWAAPSVLRPWRHKGATYVHRDRPFGQDDLLREMDVAGVDRAILVPPSWEGDRNDLALAAARQHPDRFGVMGRLAIERATSRNELVTWKDQPGMLGIRLTFSRGSQRGWLTDGTADWFWPAAESAGIPVMVFAPDATDRLAEIARRHPNLSLVIDHLGLPADVSADAITGAVGDVLRLARYPNVAVKASALPCYVAETYPFPTLHRVICRLVEAFGRERVFWGTDLTRLPCTYREALTLFTEEVTCLSSRDKEWIMGRGIARWLAWPLPAAEERRAMGN